jgi:hypothetical protein
MTSLGHTDFHIDRIDSILLHHCPRRRSCHFYHSFVPTARTPASQRATCLGNSIGIGGRHCVFFWILGFRFQVEFRARLRSRTQGDALRQSGQRSPSVPVRVLNHVDGIGWRYFRLDPEHGNSHPANGGTELPM